MTVDVSLVDRAAAAVRLEFLSEVDFEDLDVLEDRLLFRQPPPTGTLRKTPPLVQYRRHALQKWRG